MLLKNILKNCATRYHNYKVLIRRCATIDHGCGGFNYIYGGPLSSKLVFLKRFTWISTSASLGLIYYVKYVTPNPDDKQVKYSICVVLLSLLPTLLIYSLSRRYIKAIYFNPEQVLFKVETINALTLTESVVIKPNEIMFDPTRLVYSIGIGKKKYFLHDELPQAQEFLKFVALYKDMERNEEQPLPSTEE
ncbi:hypothetical protein RF11_10528 [Thelohanellus kitauei]|uniref:Transmembrane protein 70, mitochondrial n=1 Tax=Thelohanellus kitauei TaxID=669202 RepID=A0A0C2M8N8_THEKT|nr:hypothetical protein RF11_10528 [Thelohanellus kitauei]